MIPNDTGVTLSSGKRGRSTEFAVRRESTLEMDTFHAKESGIAAVPLGQHRGDLVSSLCEGLSESSLAGGPTRCGLAPRRLSL
jgi:hypothetical protein